MSLYSETYKETDTIPTILRVFIDLRDGLLASGIKAPTIDAVLDGVFEELAMDITQEGYFQIKALYNESWGLDFGD